jgi:hypothetical protein
MNERIKQLAVEAGMILGDVSEFDMAKFMPKEVKFAELLVKECAMLVEGFILEQEVALDDYQEYEASAVLKEHFGVEE